MANKSDSIIDSLDTESEGYPKSSEQKPSVYIVNSNYNPDQESTDNFEEVDIPVFTVHTEDEPTTIAPDLHLAAKGVEPQNKHQHQTYSMFPKNLGHSLFAIVNVTVS